MLIAKACNGIIIFPVVYFFFPETKKYSLEDVSAPLSFHDLIKVDPADLTVQLDIIFALAHEQGKSPVWISKSGEIPEAGSPEAEAILGRKPARPDMSEKGQAKKHSFGASRIVSREKDKRQASHREEA